MPGRHDHGEFITHSRVYKYSPETIKALADRLHIRPEEVTAEHLRGVQPDETVEGS